MSYLYPSWVDSHGVVHMVGLHTNTRILTECGMIIVQGQIDLLVARYLASFEAPNCLQCVVEFEPY